MIPVVRCLTPGCPSKKEINRVTKDGCTYYPPARHVLGSWRTREDRADCLCGWCDGPAAPVNEDEYFKAFRQGARFA